MTIVGGSTQASNAAIQAAASEMIMPVEAGNPAPAVTAQAATPAANNPAPVATPDVSQAKSDADKAATLLNGVDIPTFTEEGTPPAATETPLEVDDEADLPKDPGAENFKKLRSVIKETRQTKRQVEAERDEARAKLERYEKGEVVPDIIRAKDEKIARLEPLARVTDLKISDEYVETFVKPAGELRTKLEKIGEDYGLKPEFMQQLVGIESRKDLNATLDRFFGETGGLEVKQIVDELRDLGNRALEAEKEPGEVLQTLRAQRQEREQAEMQQRGAVFEATAKDAWGKALEKTAKEGAYKELIKHPTDSKFNKEVVEPIQYRASVQFGALMKQLAQNGLKTVPPELAEGLARMVLLSIGGALNLNAKASAEKRVNQLITNTQRESSLIRPSIGGQNGSGSQTGTGGQPHKPLNVKSASDQLKLPS